MRTPELIDPQAPEDMPLLARRIFFIAALASLALAGLSCFFVIPGLQEVLGQKADEWGELDRTRSIFAGLPAALCGVFAAGIGWDGSPKKASRIAALIGFTLNLAVLLVGGLPFLKEFLKTL